MTDSNDMIPSGIDIAEDVRDAVQDLLRFGKPNIADVVGIEFLKLHKDEVVARMPVDRRTHQPFGILHGGASVLLAETVCSLGSWFHIDRETQAAVGVEINANHLRSVRDGFVYATGKPLHKGATTQVWEIRITDDKDRLVCISRCTVAIVRRRN
jgi:1,4-dihydroxy-2-naphthoyl-CoA hydrolase